MTILARNQGKAWTAADHELLAEMFCAGMNLEQLCLHFGRTASGIVSKLQALRHLDQHMRKVDPDPWCLVAEVMLLDTKMKRDA